MLTPALLNKIKQKLDQLENKPFISEQKPTPSPDSCVQNSPQAQQNGGQVNHDSKANQNQNSINNQASNSAKPKLSNSIVIDDSDESPSPIMGGRESYIQSTYQNEIIKNDKVSKSEILNIISFPLKFKPNEKKQGCPKTNIISSSEKFKKLIEEKLKNMPVTENKKANKQNLDKSQLIEINEEENITLDSFFIQKSLPALHLPSQNVHQPKTNSTDKEKITEINSPNIPAKLPPQEEKKNEQVKQFRAGIYVYMIDNLLEITGKVPNIVLKLYMKQLAEKKGISFQKILISYGIEYMIYKFYETHDIQSYFNEKYILSELESLVPQLMLEIGLTNFNILRHIIQGVANKFKIKPLDVSDQWIVNAIKKKRKLLKQHNVNYEVTLSMAKPTNNTVANQEPSQESVRQYKYTSLQEYIKQNPKLSVDISVIGEEIFEGSDRVGTQSQLKYYKKLKQKVKSNRKQQVMLQEKSESMQEGINSQQNCYEPLPIEIIKIRCKLPPGVEILAEYLQEQFEEISIQSQKQKQKDGLKAQIKRAKRKEKQNEKNKRQKEQKIKDKTFEIAIKPIKISKSAKLYHFVQDEVWMENQSSSIQSERSNQKISKATEENTRKFVSVQKTTPTIVHPASQPPKYQKNGCQLMKSEDILKGLDSRLYTYYMKTPSLTIEGLKSQISRVLTDELRVPTQFHKKIELVWFQQYKKD